MTEFWIFNNSICKRFLNLSEAGYLRLRRVVVKRIAVIKFVVDIGIGSGAGHCQFEVRVSMS